MTGRAYYKEPYWDVVHEWEDDMSEVFGALVDDFHSGIKGVINRIYLPVKRKLSKKQEYFKLTGNSCDFTWIMDAKNYKLYTRPGVVPVFLDFNTNMVDEIFVATRTLPFFGLQVMIFIRFLRKRVLEMYIGCHCVFQIGIYRKAYMIKILM